MSGDLRALAEAATPGPWEAQGGLVVAQPGPLAKYVCDAFDEPQASERDASFIAAANPAAILALLDERDALAAKVERVEARARRCRPDPRRTRRPAVTNYCLRPV